MANIAARDGSGSVVEIYAKGAGTPADPYRYTSEGFLPFAWKVTTAGTGYDLNDRLLLKQESNETFQWYKITSTGTVSGLGNTNIPAANREELSGSGGASSSTPAYIGVAKTTSGTEYTAGDEVLIIFTTAGVPSGGYNLDKGAALTAAPNAAHFNFSSSSSTSSGGTIAVTYDIVAGATGLQGAWDVTNATVYPSGGGTAIAIGTTTGNARNLVIASGSSSSAVAQTFQYIAIQNNAVAGVVNGRRYDRRRLVNNSTNAVLTPDAWTDYELGTELSATQIAAISITADFDPNPITTTAAVALKSQDWIVVPHTGDAASGLAKRAIAREYVAQDAAGTVTAPFWTNVSDATITAPNRTNLVRAEVGYPESVLVEYAINSAPTVFLNGFAVRLPSGTFDLYSDYALSTPVVQGAAAGEVLATSIRPRTVSSSGGGVAVLYDIVGGASGIEGAWDITNAQVRPKDGGVAIIIGTATGNATNLRFPATSANYVDYRVNTAHNGLALNDEVRENITSLGSTWTLLTGGALPGATPIRANLTRISGTTVESIELNTGIITPKTQRVTLATDDALNTEVVANNPILYDDGATLGIKGRQIVVRNKATGNRTVTNLIADYSVAIPVTATNIRPDASASTLATMPLTAIANSTKIIEVPEPGDAAVAGSGTVPFRPAPGALSLSETAADLNGIPATATAVSLTIWPSATTRNDLSNPNQTYLAGLLLIYTIDGTDPNWGVGATLAPNGVPLKYGDRLILNRTDALRLRVLANSDTNTTVPTSPGRPQITFYSLEGTAPDLPIYQAYDWSISAGSTGSDTLSTQLPASLGSKAGAQSLSIVHATDDPLLTEVIANNSILYDNGSTLGIKGWQLVTRNRPTGTPTIVNLLADYSATIPGTATNIREAPTPLGSGGGLAVLYDVVGGTANIEGAWDITNGQVRPQSGGAAIAIGTATGNATNLRSLGRSGAPLIVNGSGVIQPVKRSSLTYLYGSDTNATVAVTTPVAPVGQRHIVEQVIFSFSGGFLPVSGAAFTLAGETTMSFDVTTAGVGPIEICFRGAAAASVTATLAAGGTNVIGKLTIGYRTEVV